MDIWKTVSERWFFSRIYLNSITSLSISMAIQVDEKYGIYSYAATPLNICT